MMKHKEDKKPECIYEEDGVSMCSSFEFGILEWLRVDEIEVFIDSYLVIERVTTCIHCGAIDVVYPM